MHSTEMLVNPAFFAMAPLVKLRFWLVPNEETERKETKVLPRDEAQRKDKERSEL